MMPNINTLDLRPSRPTTAAPFERPGSATIPAALIALLATALTLAVCAPALAEGESLNPGAGGASISATARFEPRSITFTSARHGWALGDVRCGHTTCLALRETRNGGREWLARRVPASLAEAIRHEPGGVRAQLENMSLRLHFADARDGWIFGALGAAPLLWSTHDGGKTWAEVTPRRLAAGSEGSVLDLASATGVVRLLVFGSRGVIAERSPVAADHWRVSKTPHLGLPAGGGLLVGGLELQGSAGWLVEGNDRGVTGSARLDASGRWVSWTPPCASVGDSFEIPVATSPQDLVTDCVMGGFASPLPATAPPGATLDSTWLYLSTDGGTTFSAGPELGTIGSSFAVAASPSPGVLLVSRSGTQGDALIESVDGGAHWTAVYAGLAGAVEFPTTENGFAIMESAHRSTKLIRTADEGRHWTPVAF